MADLSHSQFLRRADDFECHHVMERGLRSQRLPDGALLLGGNANLRAGEYLWD